MTPDFTAPDHEWEVEFEQFMDHVEDGSLTFSEQLPLARKFAWEGINGKRVPEGFWLRHNCKTRACVNPAHAELVAHAA